MSNKVGMRLRASVMAFAVATSAAMAVAPIVSAAGNAAYTTFDAVAGGCLDSPNGINCNNYAAKEDVYMNGGPTGGNGLANGSYYFTVLAPGSQNGGFVDNADGNLSTGSTDDVCGGGSATDRSFTKNSNGTITNTGSHATGTDPQGNLVIQLFPYCDTPNPGGVYILAICQVGATSPSQCKYDAFKVEPATTPLLTDLTVLKDATPSFTREFNWTILKSVDACAVESGVGGCNITGSTKTLNYTVTVTKDAGTDSGWQVNGTITVFNPNDASVSGVDITDAVDNGGVCTVTGGSSLTIAANDTATATYNCTYASAPSPSSGTNTATATWPVSDTNLPGTSGTASFSIGFSFGAPTTVIHESVSLSDVHTTTPLPTGSAACGTLPSGTISGSQTFNYSCVVTVPHDCVQLDNTATFTATDPDGDADDTGSKSVTAKVCRVPAATGALTMGFWQNKNGQGIIKSADQTALLTYLKGYNPFSDAPYFGGSTTVAGYVYNVIKAATCGGSTCNAMLKAQMLATALDVYFGGGLGGNPIGAPSPIGAVNIDLTNICQMIDGSGGVSTCGGTYEDVSAEFGGATCMTVSAMLSYQNTADPLPDAGLAWYGQVKATQVLAKDAFDAINNRVAFSC